MTGWKARGLAAACAATAVSALAFIAPGAASAACTGANIKANGSSLQAKAQESYWSPGFNAKCTAEHEQVSYESTSSGKGLASWWVGHSTEKYKGFGASNAFVGTDQPPNAAQVKEILEKGTGNVLSIPVLQASVALPIHLPAGCTATSGKGKKEIGRLVLSDETLQKIFAHTITKWSEVASFNDDALVGEHCEKEAPVVRVVRKEGSGTTAIVKKFLFEINKSTVDGTETWNELAEKDENLKWPAEAEAEKVLIRAEKGSGIAKIVQETAGTIGYANLNEVRANEAFTPKGGGGEHEAIFWPELQSSGKKFEDPATEDSEKLLEGNTQANANCLDEDYVSLNGTGKAAKFPPASTEDVWNEVTASTKQKKSYPLCGFTYDLSLTKFEAFNETEHPTTAAEVETVKNYLKYVLTTGQSKLEGKDFLGLPTGKKSTGVLEKAQQGVEKIGF